MEFTKSLIKGKLIKRYKRFFVDVKINKEVVTAHCPNTGSMKGLLDEGNEVYLLKNDNPKRKLKYGLELIKANNNLVGVNTHIANKIVEHGLNANLINELKLKGHQINYPVPPLGGGQMILIDEEKNLLIGASDWRKDGLAIGY